jgi:hypothetical protein
MDKIQKEYECFCDGPGLVSELIAPRPKPAEFVKEKTKQGKPCSRRVPIR